MQFPKWKYHPARAARIVKTAREESDLGEGWADSPAAFGVETAPGLEPDPAISSRRLAPAASAVVEPIKEADPEPEMPAPAQAVEAVAPPASIKVRGKPGRKPKIAQDAQASGGDAA